MNCETIHDQLLAADDLGALPADLASHVQSCPTCAAALARLQRIESAATALPPAEGSFVAQQAFLKQLESAPFRLHNPAPRRATVWLRSAIVSGPRLALAASVLLALVAGLWLLTSGTSQTARADPALVDQLVDWNVRLASAESFEERSQIYADSAITLRKAVDQNDLPAAEQELARKLMDTGNSLAQSSDPLEDAERFGDVADLLLHRMQAASKKNDVQAVRRYSRNYALVSGVGLSEKIAKARKANANAPKPGQGPAAGFLKLEKAVQKDAELRARLEKILSESPDATVAEIRKELQAARKERREQLKRRGGTKIDLPDQ
jgi:hypothetical protein